ncbi:dolichyl-diphosphooligosaccharide--protein glycosyltransferase subunit Ost2p [[Candida] jaroonii]|uniref:Dolichyl-diphosphooligosaccharide--protein glycosyltransferase subunit Ost2p n=1 Tax=[Candida] jaroonii TaxID=467808 RepID=A0ACA9YF50_9ASCO|nr:dolichyl-diphosphooligosaccharide--protein glycosyltransferase subunit Ost2p [[Candida] jaroonii]
MKKSTKTSVIDDLVNTINTTYSDYVKSLTPRTKLIDTFLLYLLALGILQFIYVLLVGNFPFNAFLGGFISCVGQFVLVVNLRLQYNAENFKIFNSTPERALGDFIFASLILHFIVYHFIN